MIPALSIAISVVVAVVLSVFYYLKKTLSYWLDRGIAHQLGKLLFGHLYGVGSKVTIVDRIDEHYKKFKNNGYFGMYFITRPGLILTNLDLIKTVCVKDFTSFHDRGLYLNEIGDPLAAHLYFLNGIKWRTMRTKLSPTFTSGRIKYMFSTIADKCDDLNTTMDELIAKPSPIDIKQLCVRFTADVVSSAAFGIEANALANENSEILKIAQIIFDPSTLLSIIVHYIPSLIRQTVENREKNNIQRNDFINILFVLIIKNLGRIESIDSLKAEEVGKITFNELIAQSFVFFFAGYETTSTALAFCLFELSRNLEVQEKAREEILNDLNDHGDKLTYEGIMSMTYLDQCFNESLRKFPPVSLLFRVVTEDYKIPNTNHAIEKGTQVFIPTYSIHNDEKIFPNPEKFDPERFSTENIKTRHPYAFIPFGEGPRNCIGMRFAQIQAKVGLASLLSKFRFKLNEKTQIPHKLDPANLNMGILGGFWVDVERLE